MLLKTSGRIVFWGEEALVVCKRLLLVMGRSVFASHVSHRSSYAASDNSLATRFHCILDDANMNISFC